MARQTDGRRITAESAAALKVGYAVAIATSGLFAHSAADTRIDGVVVEIGGETSAPYTSTIQIDGVVQMVSDGAAAIDEADAIAAGAVAGNVKTRAIADGATTRYFAGFALSPAAATANLLVDVLLAPFVLSNT
jgi:predicted pyridoxine 5'-phosphate oxidase superfamily flavin-nucleotide-binding protein